MRPSSSSGRRRALAMRDGAVPPCQAMTTVPPGRTTRCSSPTAASRSGDIPTLSHRDHSVDAGVGKSGPVGEPEVEPNPPVAHGLPVVPAGLVAHLRGRVDPTNARLLRCVRRVVGLDRPAHSRSRGRGARVERPQVRRPHSSCLLFHSMNRPPSGRASRSDARTGCWSRGRGSPVFFRAMTPRWDFNPG